MNMPNWKPAIVFFSLFIGGCAKVIYGEDTLFASGYSERAFRQVSIGDSRQRVLALLGKPLSQSTQLWSEIWAYTTTRDTSPQTGPASGALKFNLFGPVTYLRFSRSGFVAGMSGDYLRDKAVGLSKAQVIERFGAPTWRDLKPYELIFHYSASRRSGTYQRREVHFNSADKVTSTVSAMYYD